MPRDLQGVQRRRRHFKEGKAKERRARGRGGLAVKRHFDRGDALVDLADGRLRLHVFQIAVGPGVVRDGVALGRDSSHQFGMFGGRLADQEEGRAHAFMRQRRQHLLRPSPATGRRRRSAPPRGPQAAASAESSSGRRAGWSAASTARTREVPSASLRGHSAAGAAATDVIDAATAAAQRRAEISGHLPLAIFGIALGVADWVMRAAITQTSSLNSVKPARRGMAENIDVAQAARNLRQARCSTVSRCGTKRGKFVTSSSKRSRAPSMPPTGRYCARWWRNCTRPISAI